MSFDIAAFIKKFASSFTHALGNLDRRIDCPRHFAGFGLRRLLRASDCPHAYGHGERLRPWLSCPTRRCDGGFQSAVAKLTLRAKLTWFVMYNTDQFGCAWFSHVTSCRVVNPSQRSPRHSVVSRDRCASHTQRSFFFSINDAMNERAAPRRVSPRRGPFLPSSLIATKRGQNRRTEDASPG